MSLYLDLYSFENFNENYFKIDDILATQERLVCRFETEIPNMGYLDTSSDSTNILPGTKLELPLWLVLPLSTRQRQYATVDLPKQYGSAYREIFSADASVVDLHKLGPHYYRLGLQLVNCCYLEAVDICKSLLTTFQKRLCRIIDTSLNSSEQDANKFKEILDQVERCLYRCGQKCTQEFLKWQSREIEKITSSDMVVNIRKRKRYQMENS
ncbi:hypothetical protein HELRODRAFT_185921 [Helobdella robusta]|uniref:DNA replication complex GINS protein PSF3 n=1 Tax=Helobdella robusta TaxID=6412 RepID=T1FNF9_HELRO|nr:hypothetical protein HELRODRAFT_185921 [Helobdella robusta]ESN97202.1 hypothetical protein HELRODRAFT_185921 [Helobdella robusta]